MKERHMRCLVVVEIRGCSTPGKRSVRVISSTGEGGGGGGGKGVCGEGNRLCDKGCSLWH